MDDENRVRYFRFNHDVYQRYPYVYKPWAKLVDGKYYMKDFLSDVDWKDFIPYKPEENLTEVLEEDVFLHIMENEL